MKIPVEPIVQTKIVKQKINLPQRPDEIPLFQTKELPLIINKNGKSYIALSSDLWEKIKKILLDNDLYQKASEKWMNDIEKQANEGNNPDK